MSELENSFVAAAERVKSLSYSPSNEILLDLYSLYKQALFGDNNTTKPGMFSFKEKAKWEAWNSLKGKKSKEEAMKDYIGLVNKLFQGAQQQK